MRIRRREVLALHASLYVLLRRLCIFEQRSTHGLALEDWGKSVRQKQDTLGFGSFLFY